MEIEFYAFPKMAVGRLLASSEVFSSPIELNRTCEIALHRYDNYEALFQHQVKYLTDRNKVIFTLSKDRGR